MTAPAPDDWRRQGQEKYLRGASLVCRPYSRRSENWDHDHCEFCNAKFSVAGTPETLAEGYATDDGYRWICVRCFEDFHEEFQWTTIGTTKTG